MTVKVYSWICYQSRQYGAAGQHDGLTFIWDGIIDPFLPATQVFASILRYGYLRGDRHGGNTGESGCRCGSHIQPFERDANEAEMAAYKAQQMSSMQIPSRMMEATFTRREDPVYASPAPAPAPVPSHHAELMLMLAKHHDTAIELLKAIHINQKKEVETTMVAAADSSTTTKGMIAEAKETFFSEGADSAWRTAALLAVDSVRTAIKSAKPLIPVKYRKFHTSFVEFSETPIGGAVLGYGVGLLCAQAPIPGMSQAKRKRIGYELRVGAKTAGLYTVIKPLVGIGSSLIFGSLAGIFKNLPNLPEEEVVRVAVDAEEVGGGGLFSQMENEFKKTNEELVKAQAAKAK